jgi:hypothetical protein
MLSRHSQLDRWRIQARLWLEWGTALLAKAAIKTQHSKLTHSLWKSSATFIGIRSGSDTWIDNEVSQRVQETLGYEVVDRCVRYRKTL